MKYWILKVEHAFGVEESFDLRRFKKIRAGDDTANHICLQTIRVPSDLQLIQMGLKGPQIRLTNEISHSLKGQTKKLKDWKTRLYQGSVYQAEAFCSWEIEGVRFSLTPVETLDLSKYAEKDDPKVRKHLLQSLGFSAATHLSIVLLLFLFAFVAHQFQSSSPELEVQKVSIQQVKELFKQPEPEPEPIQETPEAPQETQVTKKEETRTAQKPAKAKAANTGGQPAASAAGAGAKKQEVTGMGLLALQSATTSQDRSLKLSKPKVSAQVAEADVGASFSSTGLGIRSGGQDRSVAMLGGISGSSYQSGELGSQVQATDGKGIQLVRKEIEIRGGLDAAIIQQIIEERLSEVRYCYENALLSKSGLSGKISTSWTIQADGSVANLASASDDLNEKILHDCIKERIVKWRFPQPKGGGVVHVKYPFVFSSLGG